MDIAIVNPILATPNLTSVLDVGRPVVLTEAELRTTSINQLGRALADLGHRVSVYAAQDYLGRDEVALSDHLTVVGVPTQLRGVFNPALVPFTPRIGELIRRRGADVIQSGDCFQLTTLFSSRAAASIGAAFLVWQEAFRHMRFPGPLYEEGFELVAGRTLRARTRCFVPRTVRARAYLEGLGVSPATIADWIPNAVDGAIFHPGTATRAPEDFGFASGTPLAIVVARLSPPKGVDLAIRAVAILRRRGVKVGLLVRGSGPEKAHLEALARQEDVSDVVRFVPRVSQEELVGLYNSCDLSIVPSRTEWLPYAMIEAGACGLPSVASEAGCMNDFADGGRCGIVVPPESPEAIADGVGRMIQDDEFREQMGAAARQRFLEHFELRGVATRFARLYADLVAAQPPGAPRSNT